MAGLQLSGLSSGVDTSGVVQQLIALERQPITKLELRKRVIDHRQTALEDVNTRLKNLKTKAAELRTLVASTTQTVESSLPGKVSAKLISGAGPGGYELSVQKLATAAQSTFAFNGPQSSAHFIDINGVQIEIRADAELSDVVATINASSTSPVYAAAVDNQLVLSSRTTGQGVTLTASGASIGAEAVPLRKPGTDAEFTLDGVARTSATNVMKNVVPGLELTLKGTTPAGETASITVGAPPTEAETIKTKLKAFVEQYNSTVDFVRGKLAEKRVPNATTESDMKKGVLFNDTALSGVLYKLRASIGDVIPGLTGYDQLTDIGVSTGGSTGSFSADSVAGKLQLDEAKLDEALSSDLAGVKQLIGAVSGSSGFAQRIEGLLDPLTKTGGDMATRIQSAESEMKRISDRMTVMERRVADKEKRLTAQFTAMEQRLGNFNAQGAWLGAQLAALSR